MIPYERKAYIEFLDKKNIRITTPFRQKDFDLESLEKRGHWFVDLINLTTAASSDNFSFCAWVYTSDSNKTNEYLLEIFANAKEQEIDRVSFSDGGKTIKIKILE